MKRSSYTTSRGIVSGLGMALKVTGRLMDEVMRLYVRALRRRKGLLLIITMGYSVAASAFVFRPYVTKTWEHITGRNRAEEQVKMLQAMLERQQRIADTLTNRVKKDVFIRNLEFHEQWKDEHSRTEILRLMEFADFAVQKDDFLRARRLYEEAAQVQDTLSVPYYLGRLAYIQGDLSEAEASWRQVIKADSELHYPEIRLYLGVTLYEMGREREGKEYLKDYL